MKATGLAETKKNQEKSDSEEAGNADADEAAIGEEDNDEEDNDEEDNDEEDNDGEDNDEEDTAEEDTGEKDNGEEGTGRNGAENAQEAMPATEFNQMSDQLPLRITGTESLLAEHTGRAHGEETQDVNALQTPPAASASQPAARQAEPITDLPTALTSSTLAAPLLDRNDIVHCPSVSKTEREIHVMDTIFFCCLHFNFHLSRYRKQRAITAIRTEVSDIQRHVNDVLRLPYEKAVPEIKKEHAAFYSKKMQARYMETIFWHFIQEAAKKINPEDCPVPKGPLDNFSREEKKAHLEFMADAGYKTGATNARHYRRLWKNLYTMRESGVDRILMYRTKEFDSFCESFHSDATPSLLDTVKKWEEQYGPQISLLERRIENAARNGLSEDPLRSQPEIAERLKVEIKAWHGDSNRWYSDQESASFTAAYGPLGADSPPHGRLRDIPTKQCETRDMSFFIVLKPRGNEGIMVCPVTTIKPGDFLGIFSGEIRYSNSLSKTHGIPGPQEKLWLDYSRITGALNLMQTTWSGQAANVSLQWESYQPAKKSKAVWRVAVRAVRAIKPFEGITRSACHELQYQLHQDDVAARRGFLRAS